MIFFYLNSQFLQEVKGLANSEKSFFFFFNQDDEKNSDLLMLIKLKNKFRIKSASTHFSFNY